MTFELRWYQTEALSKVWQYFQNGGTGNPVIAHPTGTGKSLIPAKFIKDVMAIWPTQRFLMMTHVKELIVQNADKLTTMWPNAPLGIFSAGLKQKEAAFPIVFGGIQSMYRNPHLFGHRDIGFIDEAHLVSQNDASMYLSFIKTMKLINPNFKLIGLSATPWRMGQGYITDGGLFTDIVHDMTSMENFNRLIAEGFLCPLVPYRTSTQLDVSNVGMSNGDYNQTQLEGAVDKQEITYAALREFVEAWHTRNRRKGLLFASGVEHAEHIAEMLSSFGIPCAAVHSKQKEFGRTEEYNDRAIAALKSGELPTIVNYGKLTTGFDDPWIDIIGGFRPTMSVPLWVQMGGRGTRIADGKTECIYLDFAKNTPRLGPINDPLIPKKKGEKVGDAPVKICDSCGAYNHASARFCCGCGAEFQFKIKIFAKSGTDELIKSDLPILEWFDVTRAVYAPHTSKVSGNDSMKVTYFTGLQSFKEYVSFESKNSLGKHKAHNWWKQRHKSPPPETIAKALELQSQLRVPKKIKVWVNKKMPEVMAIEF